MWKLILINVGFIVSAITILNFIIDRIFNLIHLFKKKKGSIPFPFFHF